MSWIAIILFVALLISLKSILEKEFLKTENTIILLFWSFLFVWISSLFFIPKITLDIDPSVLGLIIVKSILFTSTIFCFFHAMKMNEISYIAPLANLTPLFVVILSFFVLGEQLTVYQLLGMFIILAGGYFLQVHHLTEFFRPLALFKNKSVLLLLSALLFSSWLTIIDRFVTRQINPHTYLFYTFGISAFIFFLCIVVQGQVTSVVKPLKKHFILLFLIALIFSTADLLYYQVVATAAVPLGLIAVLKRTSSLFSTLFGGRFFHEHRVIHKGVCCSVMLIGVLVLLL